MPAAYLLRAAAPPHLEEQTQFVGRIREDLRLAHNEHIGLKLDDADQRTARETEIFWCQSFEKNDGKHIDCRIAGSTIVCPFLNFETKLGR